MVVYRRSAFHAKVRGKLSILRITESGIRTFQIIRSTVASKVTWNFMATRNGCKMLRSCQEKLLNYLNLISGSPYSSRYGGDMKHPLLLL